LALKVLKALGGKVKMRRAELVQHLQAQDYSEREIDAMLKGLHNAGVLRCIVGKYSEVFVA
jgi:5,10-methylenetetrahydrofolate reductase